MEPKIDKKDIPTRRVKFMMVNPADLLFLFTRGLKVRKGFEILEGLPEDALLVHVAYDPVRQGIMFVVESETYDEIPVNAMPPIEVVSIKLGKGNVKIKR